jgi:alkyl hydroperoxide reductase subunit AhpC
MSLIGKKVEEFELDIYHDEQFKTITTNDWKFRYKIIIFVYD